MIHKRIVDIRRYLSQVQQRLAIPIAIPYIIGFFGVGIYLSRFMLLAPNAADGGLLLEYIRLVSQGSRSFWDFIDVYGPLNWYFPALFYQLAGDHVWGVRVWLLILKILSVSITFVLVRGLANSFYGMLAAFLMMILLGQPWQYLQTAYAFHTVLPLMLLSWYILLCMPFSKLYQNIVIAGLITALVIWIKLNSGMFLLAAQLFYCFYWLPAPHLSESKPAPQHNIFRLFQYAGLLIYAILFYLFIRQYFNKLYFFYLTGPLLLCIFWTYHYIRHESYTCSRISHHLKYWGIYFFFCIAGFMAFFLTYFGYDAGLRYWSEIFGILSRIDYMLPFPPLGMPSQYHGFNQYYWLQLPWLSTLLALIWMLWQQSLKPESVFHGRWKVILSRTSGLWLMSSFNSFVIYSRADETHIFQAVVPTVPVIFVFFYQLEALITHRRIQWLKGFRAVLLIMTLGAASTIGNLPSFNLFKTKINVWHNQSLKYLHFTDEKRFILHQNDLFTNQAAEYIDSITEQWTPVLILCENQLLNFNSHTIPFGGRYQYLFYLLRSNLLHRSDFDDLIPDEIMNQLFTDPPPVIITERGHSPLLNHIPELKPILAEQYRQTRSYGHIFIYEKTDPIGKPIKAH